CHGRFLSSGKRFSVPQPNSGSFFVWPNLRAIQRFEEISEKQTVARKVTGVFLRAYGFLLMESNDASLLTSTVRCEIRSAFADRSHHEQSLSHGMRSHLGRFFGLQPARRRARYAAARPRQFQDKSTGPGQIGGYGR